MFRKKPLDEVSSFLREVRNPLAAIRLRTPPDDEPLLFQTIHSRGHGSAADEDFLSKRIHGERSLMQKDLENTKITQA